jgi:Domain of unknown function (DUF4352)
MKLRLLPLGACCAIALAGCVSAPTVTSTPAGASPATVPAKAPAQVAVTGDTLTITGDSSGEKVAITLVHVYQHEAAGEFETPDPGDHFASVQLRYRNTGTATFSDAVANEVQVTDAQGQSYDSDIADGVGCQQFPDTETLSPGSLGLGCVLFELPAGHKIVQVQVALDSGMASDHGQWKVG